MIRPTLAAGVIASAAGLAALAGCLYGLFGPMLRGSTGERLSNFDNGLGWQAWLLFAGFGLAATGTLLAGGLLLCGKLRRLATLILSAGSWILLGLGCFTFVTVGWLVLPGALLALFALLLNDRAENRSR